MELQQLSLRASAAHLCRPGAQVQRHSLAVPELVVVVVTLAVAVMVVVVVWRIVLVLLFWLLVVLDANVPDVIQPDGSEKTPQAVQADGSILSVPAGGQRSRPRLMPQVCVTRA